MSEMLYHRRGVAFRPNQSPKMVSVRFEWVPVMEGSAAALNFGALAEEMEDRQHSLNVGIESNCLM